VGNRVQAFEVITPAFDSFVTVAVTVLVLAFGSIG